MTRADVSSELTVAPDRNDKARRMQEDWRPIIQQEQMFSDGVWRQDRRRQVCANSVASIDTAGADVFRRKTDEDDVASRVQPGGARFCPSTVRSFRLLGNSNAI